MTNSVILGAVAMASLVAALFFLRFWRKTLDRFFLLFAVAFGIDAINRAVLGMANMRQEHEPFFYVVRLFTFGLILIAIFDKNRNTRNRR